MENASKALIIAGAILLSILIIALGVLVYNQAQNAVSNASMDQNKIATYNSEFDSYLGDKVKGETVKSLMKIIVNHNLANSTDTSLLVGFCGDAVTDSTVATALNTEIQKYKVSNGKTYKVTAEYDNDTGFINKIVVAGLSK